MTQSHSDMEKVTFSEADCSVNGVVLDIQGTANSFVSRMPKIGLPGVVGGVVKRPDELRGVTVVHIPTGMAESEDRFLPNRNKKIAMARLKARVLAFIEENNLNGER